MKLKYSLFSFFFGLVLMQAIAQKSDSIKKEKRRNNIIKLNLSSGLIYSIPLVEYERIVKKNQSFAIQAGVVSLPFGSDNNSTNVQFQSSVNKSGFTVALDYRFYLPKENKDPAPHGLYLGPYLSYYHFMNENNMKVMDTNGSLVPLVLNSRLDISNIGFQVGYQFLLGKRWTVDCIVFGPSLTNYSVKMDLNGDLSNINTSEAFQQIVEKLASKFPFVESLVNNQVAEFKGHSNAWSAGFRYSLHIGYRF